MNLTYIYIIAIISGIICYKNYEGKKWLKKSIGALSLIGLIGIITYLTFRVTDNINTPDISDGWKYMLPGLLMGLPGLLLIICYLVVIAEKLNNYLKS